MSQDVDPTGSPFSRCSPLSLLCPLLRLCSADGTNLRTGPWSARAQQHCAGLKDRAFGQGVSKKGAFTKGFLTEGQGDKEME